MMGLPLMNAKAYLLLINLSNFLVLESFRALAILIFL